MPTDETDLSEVFKQVEAHRKELEVEDFGCSNMCAWAEIAAATAARRALLARVCTG